ncbi:hypothetical protein EBU58_09820, partial [bacterium]|nr:hypothetical protein [bacterium]
MRIRNPFALLRRRMLSLVSGVFRRRHTPAGRRRRHRLTDRLLDLAGDVADSFARTTDRVRESGYLTLAVPEMLEQKRVLDVGAVQDGDTLYIYIDDGGTDREAYIEQSAFGIVVSTDVNMSIAGRNAVKGNFIPDTPGDGPYTGVNTIQIYEAFHDTTQIAIPVSALGFDGGGGYSLSPSMTYTDSQFTLHRNTNPYDVTMRATGVTITGAGGGLTDGTYTISLQGGGGTGAAVTLIVNGGRVTGAFFGGGNQGSGYRDLGQASLNT